MRGTRWILVTLLVTTAIPGHAADMTVQFGGMPAGSVTFGTGLLFPRVLSKFLTPEFTLAYWTVNSPNRVYDAPLPGEFEPPYPYWGYHSEYDGRWDAVATGVRLNIENAWPLLPKFVAFGLGVAQLAAWKSDNAVHRNTYGVMNGSGFVRIQVPANRPVVFLEADVQRKLFGQDDFPDMTGAAKLGFRFGI